MKITGIIMLIYFVNTNWFMNPVRNEKDGQITNARLIDTMVPL